MLPRWLFWPLFAGTMGFFLGSAVTALFYAQSLVQWLTLESEIINGWNPTTTANVVVAIFTACLALTAILQYQALKNSNRAAHGAADAAKKSADAAMEVALPNFVVSSIYIDILNNNVELSLRQQYVEIYLKNLRNSFAVVDKSCIATVAANYLPAVPFYPPEKIHNLNFGADIPPGESHHIWVPSPFSADDIAAYIKEEKLLWVYGFIEYLDFLKLRHRMGFCASLPHRTILSFVGGGQLRFTPDGPESYTYVS